VLLIDFERQRRVEAKEKFTRGWDDHQAEGALRDQIGFGGVRIPGISAAQARAGRSELATLKHAMQASPDDGGKEAAPNSTRKSRRLGGEPAQTPRATSKKVPGSHISEKMASTVGKAGVDDAKATPGCVATNAKFSLVAADTQLTN
jgi:hypothetical protein